jgi:uncharacterized membrane protein YhaH (DUF805 family)
MSEGNLYSPPKADVSDLVGAAGGYQDINLFSAKGRLSRLQFLSYGAAFNFAASIAMAIVGGILGWIFAPLGMIAVGIAYVAIFVVYVMLAIQRSHDMNWTGWTVILAFIPLVGLIWLIKAGTQGANDYGLPPPPNSTFVKVVAWILLGLFVLSVIMFAVMGSMMGALFMQGL